MNGQPAPSPNVGLWRQVRMVSLYFQQAKIAWGGGQLKGQWRQTTPLTKLDSADTAMCTTEKSGWRRNQQEQPVRYFLRLGGCGKHFGALKDVVKEQEEETKRGGEGTHQSERHVGDDERSTAVAREGKPVKTVSGREERRPRNFPVKDFYT